MFDHLSTDLDQYHSVVFLDRTVDVQSTSIQHRTKIWVFAYCPGNLSNTLGIHDLNWTSLLRQRSYITRSFVKREEHRHSPRITGQLYNIWLNIIVIHYLFRLCSTGSVESTKSHNTV